MSYFSSVVKPCEIYFSYDIFYGIIRTDEENSDGLRKKVKEELEKEYNMNQKVTDEFINYFSEKYNVSLPNDIFFNAADIFSLFGF